MSSYPHVLLLLFELLVIDGRRRQLGDEGLRLLDPWVQLLVGLPELVDQDLGTLQASVALRVELTDGFVLLHQGLGFLLKKKREKSSSEGCKRAQEKRQLHAVSWKSRRCLWWPSTRASCNSN